MRTRRLHLPDGPLVLGVRDEDMGDVLGHFPEAAGNAWTRWEPGDDASGDKMNVRRIELPGRSVDVSIRGIDMPRVAGHFPEALGFWSLERPIESHAEHLSDADIVVEAPAAEAPAEG